MKSKSSFELNVNGGTSKETIRPTLSEPAAAAENLGLGSSTSSSRSRSFKGGLAGILKNRASVHDSIRRSSGGSAGSRSNVNGKNRLGSSATTTTTTTPISFACGGDIENESDSAINNSNSRERRARWIKNKIGFGLNNNGNGSSADTMRHNKSDSGFYPRDEDDDDDEEEVDDVDIDAEAGGTGDTETGRGSYEDEEAAEEASPRTQVHYTDESSSSSSTPTKFRRHSKSDLVNLKNRWRQHTARTAQLQQQHQQLSRISDENEVLGNDEHDQQRQWPPVPPTSSHHDSGSHVEQRVQRHGDTYLTAAAAPPRPTLQKESSLTRQNCIRYSLRNRVRNHSPSQSPQCSISSESEVSQNGSTMTKNKSCLSIYQHCPCEHDGECENIHDPSIMLNQADHSGSVDRRKQSVFFASYGVWSEESIMKSFRELSPDLTSILESAWSGQLSTLEKLFEDPENVQNIECRDGKGRTPLHLAAAQGHAGVIELLLRKGAFVDPLDPIEKATPLMCAAAAGSLASITILLDYGANVNAGYDVGKTPLHWAVQASCLDCAKKLLENGAKQNPPLVYQETSLHLAASLADPEIVQLLLSYGADMSLCKGSNRSTALHIAAEEGNAPIVRLLLKAGASHEAKDARGHTPLHIAASVDAETTGVLLDAGANPNETDRDGRTPIHAAISRGSRAAECVRLLVENHADINCQDNFGYTPLHLSAVSESSQITSILLRHGADVTIKTKAGVTALQLLVRRIPDVMRFLVDRLDSAVNIHDHEPVDPDCEVRLDFRAVVPNSEKRARRGSPKIPERAYYHTPRKETEFLTCVLAAGYKKILSHPLSEAFLSLKWQRVRKFFWASLLFQVALVLLFTIYIVSVYLIKCPSKRPEVHTDYQDSAGYHNDFGTLDTDPLHFVPSTNQTDIPIVMPKSPNTNPVRTTPRTNRAKRSVDFNPFSFNPPLGKKRPKSPTSEERTVGALAHKIHTPNISISGFKPDVSHIVTDRSNSSENTNGQDSCHMETWLTVVWCLLISFTLLMGIKETFQFLQAPFSYIKSSENWGQWALIAAVFSAAWPANIPELNLHSWQYPASAFGVFLAWGLMLLQVGRFPALGLYVQMLGKVAANFGLVIMAYACLLIAFALAFCVIFPGEPPYYSVPLAMLKVLTMMVGEVDYEEFFYDEDHPLLYPITAHILHGAFVIVVTIILMNLLVGLAVSDIQGLQKGAKLNRLSRQTALISRLESFIFSKRLQACLPKSVGLILQRSALLVPSSYNWSYYFRPNDPRDKRLPKELKQSALRLAAARHNAKHNKMNNDNNSKPHLLHCHHDSVSSEPSSIRRLEQKLDNLELQVDSVLRNLSSQMDIIRTLLEDKKVAFQGTTVTISPSSTSATDSTIS